jgi:leucyl/phenylalanyl-tRNA--protein transferase
VRTSPFGPPRTWPEDDLIGISRQFDAALAVSGYRHGVFPMPFDRGLTAWYSPLRRGILPLDGLRVPRSLRKMANRYEIRVDTAFDEVLARCGDPRRTGSWIDHGIVEVYTELHHAGVVHSVEAWTPAGQLAGGLYGVSLGGLFAGESMFHDPEVGRDASKVALIALVQILTAAGPEHRLLDVQWQTPHLETLGVTEIGRSQYLLELKRALTVPAPSWTAPSGFRPHAVTSGT